MAITFKSTDRPIWKSTILFLLIAPILVVTAQEPQETLTNEAVVKMVQSHLGAEVIVEAIRSAHGNYSLTSASLIRLRQQGVPDNVIAAMQAKQSGARPSAPRTTSPPVDTSPNTSAIIHGKWDIWPKVDPITDKHYVEAVITEDVEDNGRHGDAQVIATCDSQSLDFRIIYSGQKFKQNENAISKPRVYMRVRLDQGEAFSVGSASDHPNEAFVRFVHESHDPVTVLSNLGAALSPIRAVYANLIRVELPLDNGDAPILEIRPQDPTLKKFLNGCDFEDDSAMRPSLHTLTNRTYAGTVEGFASELPGFIQRATNAIGLRPEDYAKETAFIIEAVRTCARVTPQMYTSLGTRGRLDFSQLGAEYKVCNPRTVVSDSGRPTVRGKPRRGIEMEMSGVGNNGRTDDEKGLLVSISFSVQNADSAYRNIGFDNFGIVNAMIYSSAAAIKQPVSTTPLQKLTNRRYTGTVDGFAKEFPAFLQRAAQAMSINPDNYGKEIDFALKFVRICAQITPEMALQSAAQNFGQVNLSKLGDQYKFCHTMMGYRNISDEVKTYNKGLERGIQLQVNPHNGDWKSGQGLDIRVLFSPLKNESLTSPSSYFDSLGIVMATVH